MARPLRIEYPGAFYHVTSRGNEQQDIYKSKKDREQFLHYLETAKERYGAVIHTYCLMDNHFHLLLETPKGNLSQIMRHINGAYTTYFNVKRKRAGHLFQGRYKAILVEADEYAEELSRYIHLNPVRAGMVKRPEEFEWSSYLNYIGKRKAEWFTTDFILGYFDRKNSSAHKKYQKFVEDGLGGPDKSPLFETVASTLLGSFEFVNEITERYLENKNKDRNIPALRALNSGPVIKRILDIVNNCPFKDEPLRKKAGLYLCHKYSGAKLSEIGSHFDMKDAAVSQASKRFTHEIENNRTLKNILSRTEEKLRMSYVET